MTLHQQMIASIVKHCFLFQHISMILADCMQCEERNQPLNEYFMKMILFAEVNVSATSQRRQAKTSV